MTRIRLRYVNAFRDRHGRLRHYLRRPGRKSVPLPGLPGSAEFMDSYQAALVSVPSVEIGARRTVPGTISALVVAYYNSAEFKHQFAAATQTMRRTIIERFRVEHGDKRVALLQREHILKMLARLERPYAQKNWIKTIRGLMRFAVSINMRADDPTEGIKTNRPAKSDGFRTWGEAEIAAFRAHHALGARARLALELLLGTAQRRGDVVRMGRQHIRENVLCVRQNKTGAVLEIPVVAELGEALDTTPSKHLTFLTTAHGKPFTAAGFGNWFRDMCDAAGLHGFTAHGLRKAACRRLAEAGCSEKQIAAISGHLSLSEVQRYTKGADQARLARDAMDAVQEAFPTKTRTSSYKPKRPRLTNRS
jgi:integrase